jgi:hypothetical protein
MPHIIDTLEQTEYWYGQDGRPYLVEHMEQSHRVNVLNFLERRARNLMEHARWREQNAAARSLSREDYEAYIDQCMATIDGNPVDWLDSKPFVQNLRVVVGRYGALEPDSLQIESS